MYTEHFSGIVFKTEMDADHSELTSMGLNSTRQPILEFIGGGLNLMVCRLMDWRFCNKQTLSMSITSTLTLTIIKQTLYKSFFFVFAF